MNAVWNGSTSNESTGTYRTRRVAAADEAAVDAFEFGQRAHAGRRRRQRHAVVAIEQQRVVGALEAVLDQVRDHHDGGAALRAQLFGQLQHLVFGGGVQRGRRLIQKHQVGVGRERAGDQDPLALPARQHAEAVTGAVVEAHHGEGGGRHLAVGLPRPPDPADGPVATLSTTSPTVIGKAGSSAPACGT
jgi:hypothetical protein